MDEEEIIDVEIPIPPQAKRKEIQNGTDIPLPPGASLKKNESTAVPPIGGSDSKNGSISSQNIDTGLTDDLGLSLFQQQSAEIKEPPIDNDKGYSWERPVEIIGKVEGISDVPRTRLSEDIQKLYQAIDESPIFATPNSMLSKAALKAWVGAGAMTAEGEEQLQESISDFSIQKIREDPFEAARVPAAIAKTVFGGAGTVLPALIGFNTAIEGVSEIIPEEYVGAAMMPVSTMLQNGVFVIPTPSGVPIIRTTSRDPTTGEVATGELLDIIYQALLAKGQHGLAKKIANSEPLTPIDRTEMAKIMDEAVTEYKQPFKAETLKKIPEDLSVDKKVEVAPLVEKREELVADKEKLSEAFIPLQDAKIEKIDGQINELVFSDVPEREIATVKRTEKGVTTELPEEIIPAKPETIESGKTENIQFDLPKTETDAIQKPEAKVGLLRDQRIQREGELQGVERSNQPEIIAKEGVKKEEIISPEKPKTDETTTSTDTEAKTETQTKGETEGLLTKPEVPTKDVPSILNQESDLSDLQKELKKANVPEKVIKAIPKDVKLRESFLTDQKRLSESLLGLVGNFNPKEKLIRIGKFYSSIFGGRDKVLFHEAVHAATTSTFYDILKHPESYTKEQVAAAREIDNVAWKYFMSTNTLPKMIFPRLYGTTHPNEFIAEFVSNKKFREWVAENAPEKKTNIVNYLWGKILNMMGVKGTPNQKLIDIIQNNIDAVLEASAEKLKSEVPKDIQDLAAGEVKQPKPIVKEKEVPKTMEGREELPKSKTELAKQKVTSAGEALKKALKAKTLPEGVKKSGIGVDEIVDSAVKIIHEAIDAKESVEKAIKRGVDHIKKSDWYKALNEKEREQYDPLFEDHLAVVVKDRDIVQSGISHAATEAGRQEFGGASYEGRTKKTDIELNAEAERQIKDGYNIETLITRLENGEHPTDVETVILSKYKAGLEAKIEKNPSDENLNEWNRLVDATDVAGSEQAAAFRQRQGLEFRDDSLAGFFTRERDVNQGAPLTEIQKSRVQKEYEDIKAANENWQKEFDRVSAENAKLKAQQEIKKAKSTTPKTKKTHEDFVSERASLIEQLKQEWKGSPDQPTRSGLPITDKMVVLTGKLMKSYVEEGVVKLEEVIRKLTEDLKGVIPEITEKDVNDIIAGEYKKQKPTKSEVAAKLFDLREQARLTNKLDALLRGEEPKNERQKIKRNQEIESLRQKIKDFRKEKADAEKAGKEQKTKKTPEQIALDALKTRQRNEIAKLQKQLDSGDFVKPEKKPPIKLDKEAQAARDQLIRLRQEREVRIMKQEYANRNTYQRARDKIIDVLNVPRTIMSSMDFSAPLRQAIIPTLTHPSISMKAFGEMFRQSVSQKRFDRWFNDVKDHPRNKMAEDAGLYIADPHDPRLTAKEEAFMNNLAEKIPVIGKLIKGSERAYVGYLNKMRWDLFNRFTDMFEESGKTFENSPELYKGLADWVNNSTGRGNLGKLESVAPILNTALFSPRLIASRLNMLNPLFYKNLPKEVRVEALKDNLKFIGMGMAVLAVAELAGADVEVDPRSSDFGKIQVGNTRWDIWGGYQQYIRVLAQMATGQSKSASTDNINELSGKGAFGKTRGDVALSFLRGKLAPIPAVGADILAGRTIQGEDVTLLGELESHMLPLVQGDVREAMKDTGIRSLFTAGIPAVFGVGVQTYLPSGYNKTKLNDPTYKFLYDKHLNINEPKQGEMTDKEYKAFLPKREKIFKEEWKAAIKFGVFINEEGNPTVDPDAAKSLKKINELSQEELSKLMKSISAKATRDANPKPEKEKSEIEPSEEFLIEKQRRKAPVESEEMIVTE